MFLKTLLLLLFCTGCKYINRDNKTKDDDSVAPESALIELFKRSLPQAGLGLVVPASTLSLVNEKDTPITSESIKTLTTGTVKWNANLRAQFVAAGLTNALLQESMKDYFSSVSDLVFYNKGGKFFEDSADKQVVDYEKAFSQSVNPGVTETSAFYLIPTIRFVEQDKICFHFVFERSSPKAIQVKEMKKGSPMDDGTTKHVEFDDYLFSNPLPDRNIVTVPVAVTYFKTTSASLKYELKMTPTGKLLSYFSAPNIFPECDSGSCLVAVEGNATAGGTCQKFYLP